MGRSIIKTPILSFCHVVFADWSILVYLFFCERKAVPVQLTQWRQLVSFNWSWHSHGSLTPGNLDLKINRSVKTPWQEYKGFACSHSSAPEEHQISTGKLSADSFPTNTPLFTNSTNPERRFAQQTKIFPLFDAGSMLVELLSYYWLIWLKKKIK